MGRRLKWDSKLPEGSREITGTKIVAIRDREYRYGARSKQIPPAQVPLRERAGSLKIVYAMEGLELRTSLRGNDFPSGVGFKYGQGCEVLVEVFPRGREADYGRWQRELGERVSFVPRIGSPVVTSHAALAYPSGMDRIGQGGDPTAIMDVSKLTPYLKAQLPLLGVANEDMSTVMGHIDSLIKAGKAETLRKAGQLARQRRR